jgi:NAD+ synthase
MMLAFTPIPDWTSIVAGLEEFIKRAVEDHGGSGAVLGLSGGIDSAVVAALAVRALGADQVHACLLPDCDSGDDMMRDGQAVADWLGIRRLHKDMTPILQALGAYDLFPELYALPRGKRTMEIMRRKRDLLGRGTGNGFLRGYRQNADPELNRIRSLWNLKIRSRMVVIYGYAEQHKLTVLGTTNRSEYLTGSFTKYGDGAVDVEVILPLYKQRVFELAAWLGVPEAVRTKTPTGDILPDVPDEEIMGVSYEFLDRILLGLDRGLDHAEIARVTEVDVALVTHVATMITTSRHSRAAAAAPDIVLEMAECGS